MTRTNRSQTCGTAFLSTLAVETLRDRTSASQRNCQFISSTRHALKRAANRRCFTNNPIAMSTQMPEIPEVNLPEPPMPKQDFDPKVGNATAITTTEEVENELFIEETWLESILASRVEIDENNPLFELRKIADEALRVSSIAEFKRKERDEVEKLRKVKLLEEFKRDILIDQEDIEIRPGDEEDKKLESNFVVEEYDENDGYLPLPNRKLESWRFTDLRSLYSTRYEKPSLDPSNGNPNPSTSLSNFDFSPYISNEAGIIISFVDGVYSQELSQFNKNDDYNNIMNSKGFVGSVKDYKGDLSDVQTMFTQSELGDDIKNGGGLFPAVGNAIASDAAIIDIPDEFVSEAPIVVCFISTSPSSSGAKASAPRLLIHAGSRSSFSLIEYYMSTDSAATKSKTTKASIFSGCAVKVDDNAKLSHFVVNFVDQNTTYIGSLHTTVKSNGQYNFRQLGIGGSLGRLSCGIELVGEASKADIKGLSFTDGRRVQDLHSQVRHDSGHTRCNQLHKNIATGNGRAIFCGKIIVTKNTSDTDSQQLSKSLLLSEGASVDAMPVLAIANDDVQCSHGATVSDLSEDEIFYCRSRGLSHKQAQALLILGFVNEILSDCAVRSVNELVKGKVDQISQLSAERSLEGANFTSS